MRRSPAAPATRGLRIRGRGPWGRGGTYLLLASSTPETVNAVASQANALGTPLVCANVPWESYYANLKGNPRQPTMKPRYSVMYFLGAEHLVQCFIPMWDRIGAQLGNNHKVAAAFPNDSDGQAFSAVFPQAKITGDLQPTFK